MIKKLNMQRQNGSTSIQWIIVSLCFSCILFSEMYDDKSAADLLTDSIKNKYKNDVYSGSLP